MENKICKIIYFDEDSITDYVQIVAGGELENTVELLIQEKARRNRTLKRISVI